ncbi:MAG: bifunctional phosphoribosylaminoimidazolecarboxamide formyltransferase/IMP cyclohydrolase [Candidatus Poseidoniaceae archaeon]|nr:bifunctional phosphoribosylaminoimidazolecarboxamide formyltransferase/IMP cyclohydrolase [Candidatus Poseidoniaceae archaeon]
MTAGPDVPIRRPRALLSVYDKSDVVQLGTALAGFGYELLSTGGTARVLRQAGLAVLDVSEVTGHPEIFDGRVKSLHPAIHGPLLARLEKKEDVEGLAELDYSPIQVVAVNLYAFSEAAAQTPPLDDPELLEMIDIGGPTLVRASAKNHQNVMILTSPSQYSSFISMLQRFEGDVSKMDINVRREFALAAYQHTAEYDSAISEELHARWNGLPEKSDEVDEQARRMTKSMSISAELDMILRYGENGHQAAALYSNIGDISGTLVGAMVEGGKEMSYNNYSDADACLRLCRSLSTDEWPETPHACVIVKHNNPCGAALGATQLEAFDAALASDPESAFGSIICFNERLEKETAEAMQALFIEVLMAPAYAVEAKTIVMEKKNRRILTINSVDDRLVALDRRLVRKPIEGGWLVQTEEPPIIDWDKAEVATKIQPTEEQLNAMRFAVRVCEQVKSNAIVIVDGTATIGIGPGQTSRVEAVRIASRRAGERANGAVLASDAFFPFKDGVEQAAEAGVSAIVQPGGSIRDGEVIEEADARGMTMLFTGHRLFRH